MSKSLVEMTSKTDVVMSKGPHEVIHKGHLTPPHARHFLTPVGFTETLVGYARMIVMMQVSVRN